MITVKRKKIFSNNNGGNSTLKIVGYNRPLNLDLVTYRNGDDGWHNINNTDPYVFDKNLMDIAIQDPTDFYKLLTTNIFGSKHRFTSKNGGYYNFTTNQWNDINGNVTTFASEFGPLFAGGGYVVDNLTGIGWHTGRGGAKSFALAVADTNSIFNSGVGKFGYNSRWKIPSRNEIESIANNSINFSLNTGNPYFSMTLNRWTSTPYKYNTNYHFIYNNINCSYLLLSTNSGAVANWCRYHFI